eukprot:TRINITY_DN4621_c0_g1_i6.p1 TRINITY_DN4621_c0_g1~~TRINITY_DN4621_c0_g1_i6.p1  ORF type:complete len:280 (+),score=62.29 TRINITY_DN4621_c0_g1_i6:152-991(+)
MAPGTPRLVVHIDMKKKPWEQEKPLHNRWHPNIPAVAEVVEGELFRVETIDFTGGEIKDNDNADDVKFINLLTMHYLSGPIKVLDTAGFPARPGDLLKVEICNLGPLPGHEWGYTGIFDKNNGGGLLTDHFPSARKAIWYFDGIYAYSPHIPGVRFPGLTHPGLIGTAPSKELLDIWNERERALQNCSPEEIRLCEVLHTRPLANVPNAEGAVLGTVYLLLSCCPCEARLSSIVDNPNAVVTLAIPTAIFDQDIRPQKQGPASLPFLLKHADALRCTKD